MKALPKILLALTGVAALSLAHPASVQAGVTYQYTGNTFTTAHGDYTTSDFITATVTLSKGLRPNMSFDFVDTVIAFKFFDGVQFITTNAISSFGFSTDAHGVPFEWNIIVNSGPGLDTPFISTVNRSGQQIDDEGVIILDTNEGFNSTMPGTWRLVPDAGSTLSLMTLTLIALGLMARRFQRAAA